MKNWSLVQYWVPQMIITSFLVVQCEHTQLGIEIGKKLGISVSL